MNVYQELLKTMRTVLTTVPGLPADRRWMNTTASPPSNAPFVNDAITNIDSSYAECGPDAKRRCEATYRVGIYVPLNTDAHAALIIASAIEETFSSMQVAIDGNPLEVTSARSGPSLPDGAWLQVPVSISVTFDH